MQLATPPRPPASIGSVAVALGVATGALDAVVAIRSGSPDASPALDPLAVAGTTGGAVAALFLLLAALPGARTRARTAALAALAATPAVAIDLALLAGLDVRGRLAGFALLAVAVAAVAGWVAGRAGSGSSAGARLDALARVAPAWIAILSVLVFVVVEVLGPGWAPRLGALVGAGALALAALAWLARPRRSAVVVGGVALVGAVLWAGTTIVTPGAPRWQVPETGASASPGAPRRVVLIVADTLRRDALGTYGGSIPTPNLDALARESLVFDAARTTAPWTLPSMVSMLTGLAPDVHLATNYSAGLPESVPTLAEGLSRAGYVTGAFVKNPNLWPSRRIDRGFDTYVVYRTPGPRESVAEVLLRPWWAPIRPPSGRAAEITDDALAWLDDVGERDFFLWVHYLDPHVPYAPPEAFRPPGPPPEGLTWRLGDEVKDLQSGAMQLGEEQRAWVRELYAGEVRRLDREVGRLLDALRARSAWGETMVVFTSDHGEEFWEHDGFEHGHSLYDELLGVPLLVKPAGLAGTRRIDAPVSTASIAPMLLAACGASFDAGALSVPLLPGIGGATDPVPVVASGMLYGEERASVVFGRFKYVRTASGAERLYDLAGDPGETKSIAPGEPERLAEGRRLLDAHRARSEELRAALGIESGRTVDVGEDQRARLRALGYTE